MEVMYRRGYTKGCEATNDGQRRFCPTRTLTRGEMAVFVIRAKMNSVFPTVTSGAFTTTICQPPGTQVINIGNQYGIVHGLLAVLLRRTDDAYVLLVHPEDEGVANLQRHVAEQRRSVVNV